MQVTIELGKILTLLGTLGTIFFVFSLMPSLMEGDTDITLNKTIEFVEDETVSEVETTLIIEVIRIIGFVVLGIFALFGIYIKIKW